MKVDLFDLTAIAGATVVIVGLATVHPGLAVAGAGVLGIVVGVFGSRIQARRAAKKADAEPTISEVRT